ncbi:MAG: helix-turn-helix transcriptional regulator, partial [Lentisphaeria bacterium]|nr:helix-turn-helix transcriptional regulator [Lentisphaeria bacterium]
MGNLLPCYSEVKPPRSEVWPGEAVSSAEMLEALKDCEELLNDENSKFFYLSAVPCIDGCERYDNILRIIFNISGTWSMISAYDGEIMDQELPPRSIVAGGRCNWNSTARSQKGIHYSYSVIFCRALTRLVFSKYDAGEQKPLAFYCHYPPASALLAELIDAADKVINDRNRPRDRRMRALLTLIFEQFKLDVSNSAVPFADLPDNVAMAVHYIELNYFLPINCSSVADALHLNRTMLSNEFHRATGETMKDFIQKLRMEKACWLLQNNEL